MPPRPEQARPRPPRIPATAAWGVGLAVATALISGLAIYLNAFAVRQVPDAAVYTTLKNGVAALVLIALATGGARLDRRPLRPRQWGGLLVLGVIGGGIPFLLFFNGLAQASAPSAAFIHKTLFVWVALLAVPFLGERLGRAQVAALALLLAGQAIVLPPAGLRWGSGETLMAAATLLWALEVIVAKRLLASVPSGIAAAARMGFGLVFLAGYLAATGRLGALVEVSAAGWAWSVVTGLILTGYVATWYAALQRAPASVVASVLVVGAVVTAALQAAGSGTAPQPAVVGGYVLIAGAAAMVGWLALRRRAARAAATA